MLSNAYFLAKFRFDTAKNEPAKILQNFANFANPNPNLIGSLVAPADVVGPDAGREVRRKLELRRLRRGGGRGGGPLERLP